MAVGGGGVNDAAAVCPSQREGLHVSFAYLDGCIVAERLPRAGLSLAGSCEAMVGGGLHDPNPSRRNRNACENRSRPGAATTSGLKCTRDLPPAAPRPRT